MQYLLIWNESFDLKKKKKSYSPFRRNFILLDFFDISNLIMFFIFIFNLIIQIIENLYSNVCKITERLNNKM